MRPASLACAIAALSVASRAEADDREQWCSNAHVHAQVLKRDTPDKLLERRAELRKCSERKCPASIADACTKWMAEVENAIPSIYVDVRNDSGMAVKGVMATIDGTGFRPDDGALELNPGEHRLVIEVDGFRPERRQILVRQGKGVRVVLPLTPDRESTPRAGGEDAGSRRWPLYASVTGAALGATLTTIGLIGWNVDSGDARRTCAPGSLGGAFGGDQCKTNTGDQASEDAAHRVDRFRVLTWVGGTALVGSGVLSVYFWRTLDGPGSRHNLSPIRPQVGLGWVGVGGEFL